MLERAGGFVDDGYLILAKKVILALFILEIECIMSTDFRAFPDKLVGLARIQEDVILLLFYFFILPLS